MEFSTVMAAEQSEMQKLVRGLGVDSGELESVAGLGYGSCRMGIGGLLLPWER